MLILSNESKEHIFIINNPIYMEYKDYTYYVYLMKERPSPTGGPYVGCTTNPKERARDWRRKLKLPEKPILEVIATFKNEQEAFEFEQVMRVKHGFKREDNYRFREVLIRKTTRAKRVENMRQVGKKQGLLNKEKKLGLFGFTPEQRKLYAGMGARGKRFMVNKEGDVRLVKPDAIPTFLEKGYIMGRLYNKKPRRGRK